MSSNCILTNKFQNCKSINAKVKKFKKDNEIMDIKTNFDNDNITSSANFIHVDDFMKAIDVNGIISKHLSFNDKHNVSYTSTEVFRLLLDSCIIGKTRLSHIEELRNESGFLKIKNMDSIPTEKIFRIFLEKFNETNINDLDKIMFEINSLQSRCGEPTEIWLDIDDTVETVFGEQENSVCGYNPRYHGRPSLKLRICFNSSSGSIVTLKLYSGDTGCNSGIREFIDSCRKMTPSNHVIKGIRIDSGYYSEANCEDIESACEHYLMRVKMFPNFIDDITRNLEEDFWHEINDEYSIAEVLYKPKSWEYARRHILIRTKNCKEKNGQSELFYEYSAIVTDIDVTEMDMFEIWHLYNKRGNCEKHIRELNVGYGTEENSFEKFYKNEAYCKIKALAYNVINFWKTQLLPKEYQNWEIETTRRKVINVPGNVCGSGCYRHISIAANGLLEKIIKCVQKKFEWFLKFVVNGFKKPCYA